jgi:hypothetical protein
VPTCVDCQSKLVLLIGGGAICENACHLDNMHHPFAHSNLRSKAVFFLFGGIIGMFCSKKKQQHMLICDEPGGLHPPLKECDVCSGIRICCSALHNIGFVVAKIGGVKSFCALICH